MSLETYSYHGTEKKKVTRNKEESIAGKDGKEVIEKKGGKNQF